MIEADPINIDKLMDSYYSWLRDRTGWKQITGYIEITTPYLDRNNDYIQIYLKEDEEGFLLTDNGETIERLEQEGVKLDDNNKKDVLSIIKPYLIPYGILWDGHALKITADLNDFALKKHNLIQAIQTLEDKFPLATMMTVPPFPYK